jgi:hypothetical protein
MKKWLFVAVSCLGAVLVALVYFVAVPAGVRRNYGASQIKIPPSTPLGNESSSSEPQLTFALVPDASDSQLAVAIYVDGNKVATLPDEEPPEAVDAQNYANVYAATRQRALFAVVSEMGYGGLSYHGTIYLLNLQDDTVAELNAPMSPNIGWTQDLRYVADAPYGSTSTLVVIDVDTTKSEVVNLPRAPAVFDSQTSYISDIGFSPDSSRVAVVQGFYGLAGPDIDGGILWVVNRRNGAIRKFAESDLEPITITGWADSSSPEWSNS